LSYSNENKGSNKDVGMWRLLFPSLFNWKAKSWKLTFFFSIMKDQGILCIICIQRSEEWVECTLKKMEKKESIPWACIFFVIQNRISSTYQQNIKNNKIFGSEPWGTQRDFKTSQKNYFSFRKNFWELRRRTKV